MTWQVIVYASGGLYYFGRSDNSDAASPTFTNLTSGTLGFSGWKKWRRRGLV